MTHPRLSLALDAPDALPAAGRIALFRPTAQTDLSDLPAGRLHAVQGFRPDFDALTARGIDTAPEAECPYAAAVVFLPRSKAEARALLALACETVVPGGPVWVDGLKTDGVDSVLKDLRGRLPVSDPIAKAHGKIFRFLATPGGLAGWEAQPLEALPGFVTMPGVFSADGVDRGSALLAACLPEALPARMADIGAGWGWLAAQVLAHRGVESLDLVEAEYAACECAKQNVQDPRARVLWADALTFRPENRYSAVVMNPPFHMSRNADPALGQAFIRAAAGMLSLSGTLWMVANRHLPYEDVLRACFHEVEEITPPTGRDGAFRIVRAERPIPQSRQKAPEPVAPRRAARHSARRPR
ncbi:class I SAM-dependent methyltransferase [Sinirhodobacter populi]|uniref:Class I SAM-dependent methyltransferase n=1 Tax=Paenirhodobacter populi TaxID=2306993 RepID=A0A443K718_9RHOB|nr:methyltransferase [Sinirhodobacter populi]RWR28589.1 class I SAM-dependent methyltransferase [Sinirhodobacter populi]